jgi:hypothetical protein
MALHYPFRHLESVDVLCPSLGVRIKKASQDSGRAKFPDFALRLRNMYAALDSIDVFETCRLCGKAHAASSSSSASSSSRTDVEGGDVLVNVEATRVITCTICLMPFHRSCSEHFARRCLADKSLRKQEVAVIPADFMETSLRGKLCVDTISARGATVNLNHLSTPLVYSQCIR